MQYYSTVLRAQKPLLICLPGVPKVDEQVVVVFLEGGEEGGGGGGGRVHAARPLAYTACDGLGGTEEEGFSPRVSTPRDFRIIFAKIFDQLNLFGCSQVDQDDLKPKN